MSNKDAEAVSVESLNGWAKLQHDEQDAVRKSTEAARSALNHETNSRLVVGENLLAARKILEPKKLWVLYLRTQFDMSVATAYRYITAFQKAAKLLPKPVLEIAKEKGYRLSPRMIELTPPPDTTDKTKIVRYLETINGKRPKVVVIEANPNSILKELVHAVELDWKRIHRTLPKTKRAFAHNLIGMSMTIFGFSRPRHFSPVDIPEHFKIRPGRPKKAA